MRFVTFPLVSLIRRSKVLSLTYFKRLRRQLSKRLLVFPFQILIIENLMEGFHKHVCVDPKANSEAVGPLFFLACPLPLKVFLE